MVRERGAVMFAGHANRIVVRRFDLDGSETVRFEAVGPLHAIAPPLASQALCGVGLVEDTVHDGWPSDTTACCPACVARSEGPTGKLREMSASA